MSSSVFEREICEIDKNTYFYRFCCFRWQGQWKHQNRQKYVFLSISKISLSKTELLIQKFRFSNTFAGPLRDGHFWTSAGTTSPNATVAMRLSHSFGGRDTWCLCLGCYTRTAVLPRPVHVLRRCVEEFSRYVRGACIPHAYHVQTTCRPRAYHVHTTCISRAYRIHTTCTPRAYHMHTTWKARVYHV